MPPNADIITGIWRTKSLLKMEYILICRYLSRIYLIKIGIFKKWNWSETGILWKRKFLEPKSKISFSPI